jgi:hypothetical protein
LSLYVAEFDPEGVGEGPEEASVILGISIAKILWSDFHCARFNACNL